VFAGYLAKERENEAWHVASSVVNVLVVSLMVLSALMWLAAPWIVPTFIVAPSFASQPGQLELTIELTRIMLLSPIFMGLSALVTGVLQSYRQFLAGAIAPLVYNGVQILFALFASPFVGIHALAYGVVAGAVMMFLVQLPELTFRRTKYGLTFDLDHPGVREIFLVAGSPHAGARRGPDRVLRGHVPRLRHAGGIPHRPQLRVPADAAAARGLLDRDLGGGVPRAVALRIPRAGREDA
jgi:peptidoglycan biosynthesis protein MviN/MurJ (putative lipid II flippase)